MDWTRIWDQLVKLACAALGAAAGLFGGWSAMMTVLAACMGIDYATGVLAVGNGGTGANNAATARSNLGIPTIIYGSLPSAVTNGVLYLVPVQ